MKKLVSLVLTLVIALTSFSVVFAGTEARNAFDWIMCVDYDAIDDTSINSAGTHNGESFINAVDDNMFVEYKNVVFDRQPEAMEFVAKTSLDNSGKKSIWNQKNFYVYIDGKAEENKLATFTIKVLDDNFTTCIAEITDEIELNVPHTIYFSSPSGCSYANSYKKFRFTTGFDALSAGTRASKKIATYPYVAEKSTIYDDSYQTSVDPNNTFENLMAGEHIAKNRIGGAGQGSIFAYDGIWFPENPDFVEVDLEIYDGKQPAGVEIYIDDLDAGPVATLTHKMVSQWGDKLTLSAELDVNLDLSKEHTIYFRQIYRGLNINTIEFFAEKDSDVLWAKPYDGAELSATSTNYVANYGKTYGIVESGGTCYFTYDYVYFPRAVKSFDVLYYNHNGGTGTKPVYVYLDGSNNTPAFIVNLPNSGNSEEKLLYKDAPSAYKKASNMEAEIPAGYHTIRFSVPNGVEVYGIDFEYADSPFDLISGLNYNPDISEGQSPYFGVINNDGTGNKCFGYTTAGDVVGFSGYEFYENPALLMIRCSAAQNADIGFNLYFSDDTENPAATFTGKAPATETYGNKPTDIYLDITREVSGKKDFFIEFLSGDINIYSMQFLTEDAKKHATEWNSTYGAYNDFKAIDFTGVSNITNLDIDATGDYTVYLDTVSNPIATVTGATGRTAVMLNDGVDLSGITGLHTIRVNGATTLNKIKLADCKLSYNADDCSLDLYDFEEEYGAIIVVNENGGIKIDNDYNHDNGAVYTMPLGDAFVGDSTQLKVYFWSNLTTELTPLANVRTVKVN